MSQSIGLVVDARKDEPLYRQIFDQVVARIEAQAFPPGFRLPPTRELARELATHRNTVVRAYADLEAAGFVTSTVGRGTFVETTTPARKSSLPPKRTARPIAWTSILGRAGSSDALARGERYPRRIEGRDVVNLARMQPSIDLLPDELFRRCVARALGEHGGHAMTYALPEGIPRLRTAIAEELASRGVPTRAEDVLVTSGSQQALDLLARAILDPGDTILVDAATYSGAIDVFTLAGARLVSVPSDEEGPDVAALERAAAKGAKALYVMPNGHNPTGRTMSTARRRALVAWSQSFGIPILEDDYCAGLVLDETRAEPHLRALDGNVVYLSTFSKRLIPALRVGFVVAPAPLHTVLGRMKRVVDLGTSPVMQHALAEFMERGYLRAHMARVTREYRARRDALAEALEKHLPAECTFHLPTHGIVTWVSLPRAVSPDDVHAEAMRQGVLVSPTAMWAADASAEPGIRIAFCAEPSDRLVLGARRLGKAIRTVMARSGARETRRDRELEMV